MAAPPEEAAPPLAAPAEEEETFPAAWFRIDSDAGALQLWAGATHMFTDNVGLATDMYVNSGFLGEFDLGPAIVAGDFTFTPMVGAQFNWLTKRMAAIVPQFYAVGGPDPVYFELWLQWYNYAAFKDPLAGSTSDLYGRFFIDYEAHKYIAFGPQIEFKYAFNDAARRPLTADEIADGKTEGSKLSYMPIGGNVMLTNYGKSNTLIFFLGYDIRSVDTPDNRHLAGRLTFIHNF
jgi:hypothetical protein